jgi:hypothetical protein
MVRCHSLPKRYRPQKVIELQRRGEHDTCVELDHRHLSRYVARRDEMRRIFGHEDVWGRLLAAFARVAAV